MMLFATANANAQQQFNNGDFSNGGTPYTGQSKTPACGSMNGLANWFIDPNYDVYWPQLTSFNKGNDKYIDLTPCGRSGNGAWFSQTVNFGESVICDSMNISFDLRPQGGDANYYDAGVLVTMDGNLISPRVFSGDASKWVNKNTANFKITAGSHTFKFTGQSNGPGSFTPEVMGIDNVQLHYVAKPNFKILVNGVSQNVPTDGSAVEVPCDNVILDLSKAMPCATKYNIHVQESDLNWNRTMAYEWGSWFNTSSPGLVNIQQLATTIGIGLNYTGTDKSREGKKLIAGKLANGKDRYYRIGVCTGEPTWDCKFVLIKIIPGPALDKQYSRFSIETSAPDADGNYTVTAKAIALPANCAFYWEVNEIDANGNPIPGTQGQNLPAWWTNPLQTNFPGYSNGANAGKFNISKRYKIIRGTWCDCKAWDQSSVIVQYNYERKAVLYAELKL